MKKDLEATLRKALNSKKSIKVTRDKTSEVARVVPPLKTRVVSEEEEDRSVFSTTTLKKTVDLSTLDINDIASGGEIKRVNWFEVLKKSPSPEKRKKAVRLLSEFETSGVVNALTECALKDESKYVRLEAIEALVKQGNEKALSGLLTGIKEEKDVDIRKRLAWAYSQIKYKNIKNK